MARVKVVKIDEAAGEVTVVLPIEEAGTLSKSGTMNLLACSRGNQLTDVKFNGKDVYVNATIGTFASPKKG